MTTVSSARRSRQKLSPRRSSRLSGAPTPSRLRVLALLVLTLVMAGTIWGRLAYWQVFEHQRLAYLADAQHVDAVKLPATRGLIMDRTGYPLVLNTTVYDVSLSPQMVDPMQRSLTANALAATLNVNADDILEVLNSDQKYWVVAHRVNKEQADELQRMNMKGVLITPLAERSYLNGGISGTTLASNLLGFVDYRGDGQRGVEGGWNKELAGINGHAALDRDSSGVPILSTTHNRREAVDGQNVTLTLDSDIQYQAEQAINAGVAANHASSGSILIMDPKTGGIVAWASSNGYDANHFYDQPATKTQDPIASSLYEPGSVMKVATLSGAMDDGAIKPDTEIYDPGRITVGPWTIHDDELVNQGTVTMTKVLDYSLNVGAVRAEQMEGQDNYLRYLKAFGLTQPARVGVAEEADPSIPQRWNDVNLATTSFGQGIAVTIPQMTAAVNAIANSGVYVQPHVVQKVGNKVVTPDSHRAVSPDAAEQMKMMMRSVVQKGSGRLARVPGFELDQAGKTGTSEMPEGNGYSHSHVWASYVGFLPAENPRFTMLVVLNKPNNGSYDANEGYYAAAPIWKRLAQKLILRWQIQPEQLPPVTL